MYRKYSNIRPYYNKRPSPKNRLKISQFLVQLNAHPPISKKFDSLTLCNNTIKVNLSKYYYT